MQPQSKNKNDQIISQNSSNPAQLPALQQNPRISNQPLNPTFIGTDINNPLNTNKLGNLFEDDEEDDIGIGQGGIFQAGGVRRVLFLLNYLKVVLEI